MMLSSASTAHPHGYTDRFYAPVAQGIERCPAEAEAASSNLAGRNRSLGGCAAVGRCTLSL
jgi:hypothetical protein